MKTYVHREAARARRSKPAITAEMGTAGWARSQADRERVRSALRPPIQSSRMIDGGKSDRFEQEADRIGEQVLAAPTHADVSSAPPRIQRYTGQATGQADTAPASVGHVLAGPGRPLEPALRHEMERRFGHDFSEVRVHSGGAAEQSARAVNAQAYTVGQDIVFGAGRFAPRTHKGRLLLAHELTHVVQQSASDRNRVDSSNRTVGVLQRQTEAPAKPKGPLTVTITVVPPRLMPGSELTILALAQLYGVDLDEAESILKQREKSGAKRLGHLATGITRKEEVNKPLKIQVVLPRVEEGEAEVIKERADELAELPEDERRRIDAEADRRFWLKRGDKAKKKLGSSLDEAGERELWMRTRDEVERDRGLLQNLPEQARDFLMPDGRDLDPEQYATALRVATKVSTFTDADWALYQRRAGMTTDDYSVIEQSVDKFIKGQTATQSVIDRVKGTEKLFEAVHQPKIVETYDFIQKRSKELLPSRFKNLADYDAACDAYLKLFRDRAQEITLLALAASETVVRSELMRYTDPGEVAKIHGDLAQLRFLLASADQMLEEDEDPTDDYDQSPRVSEAYKAAKKERDAQAAGHPILKDTELDTRKVADASEKDLGDMLRGDAEDRLRDIAKTRARVINDPETIFQLDRILEMTKAELGANPGTIGEMIVKQHLSDIKFDHIFKAVATAILAIGLGLVTFGGGTVAVLAGGALLAMSVYTGVQEVERYGDALAAAHSAFDTEQTVSSDSPSAVWAALSLIAIGLDAGSLVSALRAAGPALRVLEESDDIARFAAKLNLAKNEGALTSFVKARLVARAKAARKEFGEAVTQLRKAMLKSTGKARMALGPHHLLLSTLWDILPALGRAARAAARMGVRNFEMFLARLKIHPALRGIDLDKLSEKEREIFEWIWRENSGERAAAVPARPAPHAPEPPASAHDAPTPNPPAPGHPAATAPSYPVPTAPPQAPRIIGELHPRDVRTAGTGGIESIERRINTVDNSQTVTITGELKPPMNRATAPNYNDEAMWRTLRQEHGLPDYQGAHLWGPGFGDEAAAGIMLAPEEVNLVWQSGRAEKFLREDLRELAEAASRHLGRPVAIRVRAVATSHPGTVAGGAALKEVEYNFSAVAAEGSEVMLGRVEFSVGLPPLGKVSEVKVTHLGGNWASPQ